MSDTSIEWAERVWNPTTGCDRVSPGCDNCYAATMAKRLKAMGNAKYQLDGKPPTSGPGFGLNIHPGALDLPLRWRKPKRVFVNSMSDLFHDAVPDAFLDEVFGVMAVAHALSGHEFQVLTKRHGRMRAYLTRDLRILPGGHVGSTRTAIAGAAHRWAADRINAGALSEAIEYGSGWPLPGVWLGVSVETQQWADIRVPALLETPAAVRWLSMEPLLGPVVLADDWLAGLPERRTWLDWVVVGGESGPGARPIMHPSWVRGLRDQCTSAGVPFFFKQWGNWAPDGDAPVSPGVPPVNHSMVWCASKKVAGRELDGRTWDEYPAGVA